MDRSDPCEYSANNIGNEMADLVGGVPPQSSGKSPANFKAHHHTVAERADTEDFSSDDDVAPDVPTLYDVLIHQNSRGNMEGGRWHPDLFLRGKGWGIRKRLLVEGLDVAPPTHGLRLHGR